MDAVTATTGVTTTQSQSTKSDAAALSAAADFETFLVLLTTQLKNQDPLKPLESTDFVAQLASFSAVEQQVRTNNLLGTIQDSLGGSTVADLASWIGREVGALRPAEFNGAPIPVFVDPETGADRAELVVRDSLGAEVQRLSVPLQSDVLPWAGVSETGDPLPAGSYNFSLESFRGGEVIKTANAPVYGQVEEARLSDGHPVLVLADGTLLPVDQVKSVRQADAVSRHRVQDLPASTLAQIQMRNPQA